MAFLKMKQPFSLHVGILGKPKYSVITCQFLLQKLTFEYIIVKVISNTLCLSSTS